MPARRILPGGRAADEVAVALSPGPAYARLVALAPRMTGARAFERPALVLLITGTSLAIAATGRVTVTLVASTMLAASFAIIVQLAAVVLLVAVRAPRGPAVSRAAAIDLAFAGHAPWTLWVLGVGVWAAADIGFSLAAMAVTMTVPLVWNGIILAAFCREVLGAPPGSAWVWMLAHQSVIWSFGISFIAWISGGWFRLLDP